MGNSRTASRHSIWLSGALLLALIQVPHAQSLRAVSIKFVGSGTAMGVTESAGVTARTNWNNASGATRGTPLALVDETGAATTASVTWSASGVWATPITDQAGNRRLMRGYLDTTATSTTTVTVAGLPAGAYDVYVYADGDNGSAARSASYRISGAGITATTINLTDAANTNFNATFTPANNSTGNYVKFSVNASGFTIAATPATTAAVTRAPLNGIQIVPATATAPPPPPPPPAPNFTVTATPASRTVTAGSGTSYAVTIAPVNGFAGTVNLAATGLPANTSASFTPSSITGSGSATLNVTTTASTPAGTATLTTTGISGSLTHAATTSLVVSPPSANAGAVSIKFVGSGTAMGVTESAGVTARTNWNNASGATRGTPLALVDETGAATTASVTWSASGVWATPITDQAGNRRLMRGYLDTTATSTTTVTVAGLPAGAYDVYVYADGDNGSAARSASYRISGAGITATTINLTDAANTNFNATFTPANNSPGNYVKFSVNASGFTIAATPASSAAVTRAPLNGVQIVPAVVTGPQTSTISGTISPSPAGSGATVNLGGTATATTSADAGGSFSFGAVLNGNYSVIPSKAGYTFTPSSRTVTVNGANVTGVTFTATPNAATHTISGTVGPPPFGAGTSVQLAGAGSASVAADSSGNYVFTGLPNGTYTITPGKSGYAFAPASRSVTVSDADASGISFTALGPDKERANSYDNAWETAWVNHARSVLTTTNKTAGFVLEIGDSITHAFPFAAWPTQGQGITPEDAQVLNWLRAVPWGSSNVDTTSKSGWYLAAADTTSARGMTASGGLSIGELVSGCCNGGATMPPSFNPATARQIIAAPTYTGNIQVDTLVAAFNDAQFAVVMLGTNDPTNAGNLSQLNVILDKLEAQHIVPILSTIPPRNDAFSNDLTIQFNAALASLAQTRSLPLIDYYQEILLRRPGTSWVGTLIASDGIHPTASGAGFSSSSNPYVPGGDAATHTTGDALANVGYLLRSWLTVQKLKEVKLYVVDGVNPPF